MMSSAATGEWAVSHAQKLKYTQQFNAHDPQRKGFLSGVEAKSMLQQTLLMHSVLAQIWYEHICLAGNDISGNVIIIIIKHYI